MEFKTHFNKPGTVPMVIESISLYKEGETKPISATFVIPSNASRSDLYITELPWVIKRGGLAICQNKFFISETPKMLEARITYFVSERAKGKKITIDKFDEIKETFKKP
jgi:hypothetical protein